MTISTLIKKAQASTTRRGHRLLWEKGECDWQSGEYARGVCRQCMMEVHCLTKPLPNQIDIGGEAVATNCPNNLPTIPSGEFRLLAGLRS
jgi:hypothetical protein